MKILFVSVEAAPFSSIGGLSRGISCLSRELANIGHDVRLFTIKPNVDEAEASGILSKDLQLDYTALPVRLDSVGVADTTCDIYSCRSRKFGVYSYLMTSRDFFELRANRYGYDDDHLRFAFFSKACLNWLAEEKKKKMENKKDGWFPDLIHCHDWHTGYFVEWARNNSVYKEMFDNTSIVFTIHNIAYQAHDSFTYQLPQFQDNGKGRLYFSDIKQSRKFNPMLRAIKYADAVSVVSPTYAREISEKKTGEGLYKTINKFSYKFTGILNGVDFHSFNPLTDTLIKQNFSKDLFVDERKINKKDLQAEFHLPQNRDIPLFSFVGRLVEQKGIDLLIETIPHFIKVERSQFIFLGEGDDRYRRLIAELKIRFPDNIAYHMVADFDLPRKIFSGADAVLVPSVFEPGGIVALEALRYGAVPLVRRTGGLNDIVTDFNPESLKGNGISFIDENSWVLFHAMSQLTSLYRQKKIWYALVKNCMSYRLSWEQVAPEYLRWYKTVKKTSSFSS